MAIDNYILALITYLFYKDKTYSNFGFNYYLFNKMSYVFLNNYELRIWNKLFRIRIDIIVKYYSFKVLLSILTY